MAKQTPLNKEYVNTICGQIIQIPEDQMASFKPLEDLNQAIMVANHFTNDIRIHKNKQGFKCYLRRIVYVGPGEWDTKIECASEIGSTMNEAICRAALVAKGVVV